MTSLRAKIIRSVTGAYFSKVDANKANVHEMRRRWHSWANLLWTAQGVNLEKVEMRGLTAEWLTPADAADGKLLLYLHGGAYIMGNCATHRQLVSYIARAAGVRTLLPEYRLAPEYPFPAAVDDIVGLYRGLLADGHEAQNIVIVGDSAGGGLTMATLLSLRDARDPLPAGACLLSPWLDLTTSGESIISAATKDPWFKPKDMPIVASYYCRDDQLRSALVSPVFADLDDLPPIYIQVGSDEILLSDSTRAAEKIAAGGGEVDIEIWPGMWHVFQIFVHQVPESRKAVKKIGAFVRRVLGEGELSET
jgi:acetyl esterase/lipase